MRTIVLVSVLLSPLFARAESPDALLQRQTQELVDAIAPGKADVWDRYLDERALITTEDGDVLTKAEMLKGLRPLPAGVSGSIDVKDFRVQAHGSVAVASYLLDEHENYHGHELHAQYRATDTWLREGKQWRLIGEEELAVRSDPPAIRISDADADAYTGRYALTPEITYEIRRNGSQLEGRRGEGKWEPLMVEAPDVLFVPGKPRYQKIFQRDAAGRIASFADRRESWDLVWKRLP